MIAKEKRGLRSIWLLGGGCSFSEYIRVPSATAASDLETPPVHPSLFFVRAMSDDPAGCLVSLPPLGAQWTWRPHPRAEDGRASAYSTPTCILSAAEWIALRAPDQPRDEEGGRWEEARTRFHGTDFRAAASVLAMNGQFISGPNGHDGVYGLFSCDNLPEAWLRVCRRRALEGAGHVVRASAMAVVLEFKALEVKRYIPGKSLGVTRAPKGGRVPGVYLQAVHFNVAAVTRFAFFLGRQIEERELYVCWNFVRCGVWAWGREGAPPAWHRSRRGNTYCPRCAPWWTNQDAQLDLV